MDHAVADGFERLAARGEIARKVGCPDVDAARVAAEGLADEGG
jgi:hypothetical protein